MQRFASIIYSTSPFREPRWNRLILIPAMKTWEIFSLSPYHLIISEIFLFIKYTSHKGLNCLLVFITSTRPPLEKQQQQKTWTNHASDWMQDKFNIIFRFLAEIQRIIAFDKSNISYQNCWCSKVCSSYAVQFVHTIVHYFILFLKPI